MERVHARESLYTKRRGFKPGEGQREPILAIWFSSITYIFKNLCLHDDDDDDDEGVLMHAGQLRPKVGYICIFI